VQQALLCCTLAWRLARCRLARTVDRLPSALPRYAARHSRAFSQRQPRCAPRQLPGTTGLLLRYNAAIAGAAANAAEHARHAAAFACYQGSYAGVLRLLCRRWFSAGWCCSACAGRWLTAGGGACFFRPNTRRLRHSTPTTAASLRFIYRDEQRQSGADDFMPPIFCFCMTWKKKRIVLPANDMVRGIGMLCLCRR